jgi:probable rRNA maturation factor
MIELHPHTNRGNILSRSRKARSSISVGVNNLTRSNINEAMLKKVAEHVLKGEKIKGKELSIAIVGAQKSKAFNKKYRNKEKAANVLSFPAGNDSIPSEARYHTVPGEVEGGKVGAREVEGYLGEIVLCPAEIKKDAKKYGMIFDRALAWMLIHGVLHLVGYDHHTSKQDTMRMEQKEDMYLQNL